MNTSEILHFVQDDSLKQKNPGQPGFFFLCHLRRNFGMRLIHFIDLTLDAF